MLKTARVARSVEEAIRREDETPVLAAIVQVFRTYGYEGTSLARLSEATGLIKASLYHRFPNGKEEMAQAALDATDDEFATSILAPIAEAGTPQERLAEVSRRLLRFYRNGRRACLLETLSVAGVPEAVLLHARRTLQYWTNQFATIAEESGMDRAAARIASEDAIGSLEGALVLCRVSGSAAPFRRAVAALPQQLGISQTMS